MKKQSRIKELEARIERLKEEKTYLEQWDAFIIPLESFTREDKIRGFDELYIQARDYLQEYVQSGREPKDGDSKICEAVLGKMLGKEVWNIIGAIE